MRMHRYETSITVDCQNEMSDKQSKVSQLSKRNDDIMHQIA